MGTSRPRGRGFFASAASLSPTTVARLTQQWQDKARALNTGSLAAADSVYLWVDGIHVKCCLELDQICLLVMGGPR